MTERRTRKQLLIRGNDAPKGEIISVAPHGDAWKYISFRVVRLTAGQMLDGETGNNEVAFVLIAGTVDIKTSEGSWQEIGKRADPFSGPPMAVYLPALTAYQLLAL